MCQIHLGPYSMRRVCKRHHRTNITPSVKQRLADLYGFWQVYAHCLAGARTAGPEQLYTGTLRLFLSESQTRLQSFSKERAPGVVPSEIAGLDLRAYSIDFQPRVHQGA